MVEAVPISQLLTSQLLLLCSNRYRIVGHSGDSNEISFVDLDKPPQSAKDQLQVLESMVSLNTTTVLTYELFAYCGQVM
jgi:hypothetical protein